MKIKIPFSVSMTKMVNYTFEEKGKLKTHFRSLVDQIDWSDENAIS